MIIFLSGNSFCQNRSKLKKTKSMIINCDASGEDLLKVSKYGVIGFGLVMGVLGVILNELGLSLVKYFFVCFTFVLLIRSYSTFKHIYWEYHREILTSQYFEISWTKQSRSDCLFFYFNLCYIVFCKLFLSKSVQKSMVLMVLVFFSA